MKPDSSAPQLVEGCDPAAFAALEARAFADAWKASAFADDPGRVALSLRDDSGCVGYAYGSLLLDELELLRIAVDPERRREGLGQRLLTAFLECGRERGAGRVLLEVAEDNQAALVLYLGMGFQRDGTRPNYYGKGRAAILLSRLLD